MPANQSQVYLDLLDAPALFSLEREGVPEVVIHGLVACSLARNVYCTNDLRTARFPMRSILKPWQLIAALGEVKEPNDVIGCSSHSGLPYHIASLAQFASAQNVDLALLRCPESLPMDARESGRLQVGLAQKSPVFHPCSGKHLAYIAGMQRAGRNPVEYFGTDNPIHMRLVKLISASGIRDQIWARDSCGLPTLVTSIAAMTQMWACFGRVEGASKLLEFWRQRPELIGGAERLDSWITIQSAGRLIAKEGADGILAVRSGYPEDETCIIVKIASGYQPTHLAVGLVHAIQEMQSALSREWLELLSPLRERIAKALPSDQDLRICGPGLLGPR